MKKNEKGFTLIELLAVIVILGLLMVIAIPSVTKYITQSRRKTLVKTIDSYITAVMNQVNDGEYKFSDSSKIFAVPIECVSLEKGGTDPFGNWYQANEAYWAYVLIQYDSENYNYVYGFTFKDDAGYGMYPTISANIEASGKIISTGYDDLTKPETGYALNYLTSGYWSGFDLTSTTRLIVLESSSEGEIGDGQSTCTLCQKGDNYEAVEKEKLTRPQLLTKLIKMHNEIVTAEPTLTTSSKNTSDVNGLYASNATNSGNTTYYFRGNVTNNYVKFAGFTWRIIRINEDGTVRLLITGVIGGKAFNSSVCSPEYLYYSNNNSLKSYVDSWYQTNIVDKGYDSYTSTSMFCEQAKVKSSESVYLGDADAKYFVDYKPNFKCSTDGNGKGILTLKVGLMSYDEAIFAGNYYGVSTNSYVSNGVNTAWSMTPSTYSDCLPKIWLLDIGSINAVNTGSVRPVINLNTNVLATGTGTSSDPYVIQTN